MYDNAFDSTRFEPARLHSDSITAHNLRPIFILLLRSRLALQLKQTCRMITIGRRACVVGIVHLLR